MSIRDCTIAVLNRFSTSTGRRSASYISVAAGARRSSYTGKRRFATA